VESLKNKVFVRGRTMAPILSLLPLTMGPRGGLKTNHTDDCSHEKLKNFESIPVFLRQDRSFLCWVSFV
jgi:hypothetical protein